MPTYEYQCHACGHQFERFQGINDAPVASCPECQGNVRRLLSGGGGVIVKGGASAHASQCGREQPCCGRTKRCESPSCHH
ncbi:hypothetical cytosolic protein [Candidatus Moduliflexus flocculans]|uniref:Hypothetical cytosolic protein n=1 Tax=Candidatus Moduliflexus flocculans TaxID=1499966 RepID=A0A0S6VRP5_9BACT|nr:hypothetical cytosolic protein [Candidatus Moduliflexus flocculans]